MADETLRFDIVGEDHLSEPLGRAGSSAEGLSRHMDAAARSAAILDEALKRQNTASRVSVDATLALARADKILEDAEHGLRDGALEAEFALKKQADAAKQSGSAAAKAALENEGLAKSLQKVADNAKKSGPGLLPGAALALTPAIGTIGGVAAGASIGIAGAAVAGAAALAAFGAVAKPVLSDALKAEQAVNTAQNNYNATIAAGVPKAQALANLQKANASAVLTYNAAIAGGANPAKALAAEHLAMAKNQLAYNSATSTGTFNAKAYAAEQLAIGKAYADLSPQQVALSKQLGAMANAWDNLKAAETPVVAGALQPWLKAITDLTKNLAPIISAVAPAIGDIGRQIGVLVNSSAFSVFRDWVAAIGPQSVAAAGNLLTGFLDAMITLLPQFNPLIQAANGWLSGLGDSLAHWASSQKTADQITKFMAWFSTNGPVVGGLLKNLGGALKALAPGLTAGGTAELKIISDFFGWVAKLPPAFAKPLAEAAGALLLLNKLGVVSVGVKIIGPALKWLTGGLINIGGGATAGAEIRAAMVSGGAAAAAEIRAAMAGGAAPAGAGGAAGKGAAGAGAGGAAAGGAAALGVATAGALIGAMIRAVGDALSPAGSFAGALNKDLQNLGTPISTSLLHAFTFGGLEAKLATEIGGPVGAVENNILAGAKIWGGNIASTFTGTWTNIQRGAVLWWHSIAGGISGTWTSILAGAKIWGTSIASSISGTWTNIRGGAVIAWNGIWSAITSAVTRGISAVVGFFTGLPGKIVSALSSLGVQLAAVGRAALSQLLAGAQSAVGGITSFFSSFASGIVGIFKKIWGWFSPSSVMYQGGKSLMEGLALGIKDHAHLAVAHAQAAAGATAGAAGSSGGAVAALMKQMAAARGWTGAQWNALYALEMNEAGFSLTARNPSGAYGLAQFINGPSEYAQYGGNANTAAGQITGMLNYIAQRYGTPAAAWAFEKSHVPNWYGSGLDAMFSRPTLIGVGERGPERVQVTPARSGSQDPLAAKLDQLIAEVRQLTGVAASIPRATGQHVAAGVNGAASAASFRVRYP